MEPTEESKMIQCKGERSRALYLKLGKCKECPDHGGIELMKSGQGDTPPVEIMTCKRPMKVRVTYLQGDHNGK